MTKTNISFVYKIKILSSSFAVLLSKPRVHTFVTSLSYRHPPLCLILFNIRKSRFCLNSLLLIDREESLRLDSLSLQVVKESQCAKVSLSYPKSGDWEVLLVGVKLESIRTYPYLSAVQILCSKKNFVV